MNPRNEMLNNLDEAMTAIVKGKAEAAMIPLWRIHVALRELDIRPSTRYDSDRTYTEDDQGNWREVNASIRDSIRKIAGTDKLPPMVPVKGKRIRAIDVPCSRCGAKRGEPCTGFTSPVGGEPTGEPIKTYHQARHKMAKRKNDMNRQPATPTVIPLDEV